MNENDTQQHSKELKSLNKWLIILVVFIISWTIGMFFYVEHKTNVATNKIMPVVVIDPVTGKMNTAAYSNLFPDFVVSSNLPINNTNNISNVKTNVDNINDRPMFVQKKSYDLLEFVIVNYFYVEAIVVDKDKDEYTVMYKDHNHVLQKTTVPLQLLLAPSSYNVVSPVSFLVD